MKRRSHSQQDGKSSRGDAKAAHLSKAKLQKKNVGTGSLSDKIRCLECDLLEDTIQLANDLAHEVRVERPALIVQIRDPKVLHSALKLNGSPISQKDTPEQSALAFMKMHSQGAKKAFKSRLECKIVSAASAAAFYALTSEGVNKLTYEIFRTLPWLCAVKKSKFKGRVAQVLWLVAQESGKIDMFEARQVFD